MEEIKASMVCFEFLLKLINGGLKNNFINPTRLVKRGSLIYFPSSDLKLTLDDFAAQHISRAIDKLSTDIKIGCGEWDLKTIFPFYRNLELKIKLPFIPASFSAREEANGIQARVLRSYDVSVDEMACRFDVLYYA